jgi:hypothetical protein
MYVCMEREASDDEEEEERGARSEAEQVVGSRIKSVSECLPSVESYAVDSFYQYVCTVRMVWYQDSTSNEIRRKYIL